MFSNFFSENRAVYEVMLRNMVESNDDTIRRMCFAFWITKATHTLSEYVILNAFPR